MTTPEGAALAKALGLDRPLPGGIMPLEEDSAILAALDNMAAPTLQTVEPSPPARPWTHRVGAFPACWTWEFDPTTPRGSQREQGYRLLTWQDSRCAICGCGDAGTEDHDHQSGLTRGYLCRSCNHGEGISGLRVFALYRWRHPTSILGLHLPYTGRGWKNGQPVDRIGL